MLSAGEFLQAIRERPRQRETCLVYADWLEEQGDPRGRFMRLQCVAARLLSCSPQRIALEAEAHALCLRHEAEWLGPLLGIARNWEFRRGLLASVTVEAETFLAHADEWLPALPLVGIHLRKAHPHVAALAACPQLAHLTALYLGDNNLTNDDLQVLLRSPHLRHLKELYLQNNRLGPEGMQALAACPHLPRLRELCLAANDLGPEGLQALVRTEHLRRLRNLDLSVTDLDAEGIRILAGSPLLQRLRSLRLTCNFLSSGCLKTLVESPAFRLRFLRYDMNETGDVDVQALAASPQARNLVQLSLNHAVGEYGAAGLKALSQSPTLESLQDLGLGRNAEGRWLLQEAIPELLRSPLVRRLRKLSLQGTSVGREGLAALASHPAPLRLRWCHLPLHQIEGASWEALLAGGSLRRVTGLSLRSPAPAVLSSLHGDKNLPHLSQLALSGVSLLSPEAKTLLESSWLRRLHHLSLSCPDEAEQLDVVHRLVRGSADTPLQRLELYWRLSAQEMQTLTAEGVWPQLSRLLLDSCRWGSEGAKALAAWPLLRQLRFLTIQNSSGWNIAGLEALGNSPDLGPLLRLDIDNGNVSDEARALLRQRLDGRFAPSGRKEPRTTTVGSWASLNGDDD